jgi:hypothetical protein
MTLEEYNLRFETQNGLCAICKKAETDPKKNLSVDHCHKTGALRHLLCNRCNRTLGLVKEDVHLLEEMIAYLLRWRD